MLPIAWKREFRERVSRSYSNEDSAPARLGRLSVNWAGVQDLTYFCLLPLSPSKPQDQRWRWQAQPCFKGQPLRVCLHALQSGQAHSSCGQTARPTLPLASWASSPAQDKPFFSPLFIQQLCDFLKYQSNRLHNSPHFQILLASHCSWSQFQALSCDLQVQQSLVLSVSSTSSSGTLLSLTILQPSQPFSLHQTFFHLHIFYMLSH